MPNNGYAAFSKQRAAGKSKRRALDDYETPRRHARPLTDLIRFSGPILEPACGSGRLVRSLEKLTGLEVIGSDIKEGDDFFRRKRIWDGDIISNPPYRDGLAERFCRHALKLADGKVAMLMQSGFLWGGKRGAGLYYDYLPQAIIVIPERIYFFVDGKPIESQFFNHCWIVWPSRVRRDRGDYPTYLHWAGH